MKTLDEEKIVEKLLNKKNSNNINKEGKNIKKSNKENNSSITVLDNNEEHNEKNSDKYSLNSSIPEYIQGTPIYYNNKLREEKKEQVEINEIKIQRNKKERKLSYEGPEQNKFSNIDYILGDTNDTNKKNEENNNKYDIENISLKKESGNGSSKLDKIKSSLNKLIIGQNENIKKSNRNKQPLEKRTIKRREKSE